ncbi:MAG TPA: bifunctional (p)ppGpp synthetase/guanosine-3',5'-bis(diphosphate) 3'-pyrophosphohydrolase [Rhodospirillales bacterium]|nr:bifunctional (p)ppGpp synthetase/guanosine-3',5'-bis(diphosphate) 3'-pyrophosphohydrolase [Rhodospirillales bacterium]
MMRQYELVELVRSYDPDVDEDLLNRAYVFAMKAHGSQLRASGDPYFHHPVEVAGILAQYRLDSATIATGLLHDVVEDTGVSIEEIERLFGRTVARLVDGVTKLHKLQLQSVQSAQAENFRKLLLAMSDDIRVLLVKLADRLHNMRTLHFIREPERRRRIAAETMEIYAPLAERIGMDRMKAELEDLAFAELWPEARAGIIHRLQHLQRDDTGLVERIVEELRKVLADAGIEAEVYGREKSPLSIWRKMQRKNVSFEQLSDIMAFRIMVGSVTECYAALGVIHSAYAMLPGRFKDFISTPKPNGYRSLHTTVIGPLQKKIEIQIRTREMHEEAELGVAAHWAYKQGEQVTEGRRYRWIRELLEILEHAPEPDEFLENTKLDLYRDQVFCFTPRGDLIVLPRGATPVDFAYAVHSEIGDHCSGAKVDGRMVPLDTRLENGDQVEILTSPRAAPTPEWERFVVTGKARARIRRYLRIQQRDFFIARGRELVQRLAKAERVQVTERQLERACQEFNYKSVDDLLLAVGEGRIAARLVLEAVRPELKRTRAAKVIPFPRGPKPQRPTPETTESPIVGLPSGIAFQFAGCCHPVRGDEIVGVIRTGRPINIHRRDCKVLARVRNREHNLVELGWNTRATAPRAAARLRVLAVNRPGVLGTISTTIGQQGGNITDVKFGRRNPDLYELFLDIEVEGVDHLHRLKAALRMSPVVTAVERMCG